MKDETLYLIHIRESIGRIHEYIGDDSDIILRDQLRADAVLRNLHTLSEATQKLTPESKGRHPEINWGGISGFRNVIVHDYLGVSLHRIVEILDESLPLLAAAVEDLLRAGEIE